MEMNSQDAGCWSIRHHMIGNSCICRRHLPFGSNAFLNCDALAIQKDLITTRPELKWHIAWQNGLRIIILLAPEPALEVSSHQPPFLFSKKPEYLLH